MNDDGTRTRHNVLSNKHLTLTLFSNLYSAIMSTNQPMKPEKNMMAMYLSTPGEYQPQYGFSFSVNAFKIM